LNISNAKMHSWDEWARIALKMHFEEKNRLAEVEINSLLMLLEDSFGISLERLKNKPVLDLCCGWGRHSFILAENGFNDVTAIDKSTVFIKKFE